MLRISICTQTQSLLQRLEAAEVEVVSLFELFAHEKSAVSSASKSRLYLPQDSHWSPAGLKLAARAIAQRIVERGWIELGRTRYRTTPAQSERLGDVVRMLNVLPIEKRLQPEQVLCAQVVRPETNQPYQDDPQAEILVLGDSFLRIFQQDEPGADGFIAHLARQLRQPVASIVNDGGASTLVRQELHRRPTLLKNKRVVIWEFVERDIRFGTIQDSYTGDEAAAAKVCTLNLMADGPVETPAGKVPPPGRIWGYQSHFGDRQELASAGRVITLKPGVSRLGFTGQTWKALPMQGGDFNGDGVADVVIAAGQGTQVLVHLGGDNGLDARGNVVVPLDFILHHDTKLGLADFTSTGQATVAAFGTSAVGAPGVYVRQRD